jgi:hypothetical protein
MTPRDDRDNRGSEDDALIDILRTTDLTLLAVVKSALEGAGIPFSVQGEEGLHQIPIGPFGFGFFRRVMGAVIRVQRERAEEAKAFLASFETDPPDIEAEWGKDGESAEKNPERS